MSEEQQETQEATATAPPAAALGQQLTRLRQQLEQVQIRRFAVEREVSAVSRQAGLSKSPHKLVREQTRAEARLEKLREKERELVAAIENLTQRPSKAEAETATLAGEGGEENAQA